MKGAHALRGRNVGRHGDQALIGTIRVPMALLAQSQATVRPIAEAVAGGNSQLFSPAHDEENASTHSASGWKKCEQNRVVNLFSKEANRSIEKGPHRALSSRNIAGRMQ
jgi:hypothetical protein